VNTSFLECNPVLLPYYRDRCEEKGEMKMDEKYILQGIRVVEAASMVLVPAVTAVMADFGAEVIKVEPPGGGDIHRYGHQLPGMPVSEIPYAFQAENRNKKSMVLNLKEEMGREILGDLIRKADVFATNYRATALKKLKMTYADFRKINRRLIYAYASGYGEKGPEADKPGYDMVCYWARSGIEAQVFPTDGWLSGFPYGSGDRPSGMNLLSAVLLALLSRERTGEGAKVSTSLLASGAWANSTMIQAALCGAQFNEKVPRERAYNFTYIHYMPKDGRPFKLNIHDYAKGWAPFCHAVGRPDLIDDPRFATIDVRVKHMAELIKIFDGIIAQRDLSYWVKVLTEHDIPFSPISSYDEIAVDRQMAETNVFVDVDHPKYGHFRTVDSPFTIDGSEKVKAGAAPELGEHTRVVLTEMGYPDGKIEELFAKGVVS
jgi:crotonobetainyl-CoA:carnitine CoA-transferase CaiB-like acyl-CoA transferase